MVYGPIAAFLVEMFPTKIRYTSMSLPYHIGNGWFGGMLPLLATAIVAATGDIYAGLWYPIGVSVLTLAIGLILPERHQRCRYHHQRCRYHDQFRREYSKGLATGLKPSQEKPAADHSAAGFAFSR